MTTLEFDDVRKVYDGEIVAIEDLSVTIHEGEFVVLLGPSGAGKSTLLRVINGLTDPTDGTVTIDGQEAAEARSDVGMVFQEHNLIENLSAYGNALTGALARNGVLRSFLRWHDEADKEAALEALETVGLLEAADQRVVSMSGGQKQRVGIARALVQQPGVLLADEPVASLDPKAARDVMGYLKRAAQERDLTTVTSLHQVNIAREFGDRFLGIRDGELVFDGTAEDLTMDVIDEIYYHDAVAEGPSGGTTTPQAEERLAAAQPGGDGA